MHGQGKKLYLGITIHGTLSVGKVVCKARLKSPGSDPVCCKFLLKLLFEESTEYSKDFLYTILVYTHGTVLDDSQHFFGGVDEMLVNSTHYIVRM